MMQEYNSYVADTIINLFGTTITLVFGLAWIAILIVGYWKLFEKAGLEGWKALIPFYNTYCLYKISFGRDKGWMFIFTFVPCVGTIVDIIKNVKLGEKFGKGFGFVIGLILLNPIFTLILGFDSSEYIGESLY